MQKYKMSFIYKKIWENKINGVFFIADRKFGVPYELLDSHMQISNELRIKWLYKNWWVY